MSASLNYRMSSKVVGNSDEVAEYSDTVADHIDNTVAGQIYTFDEGSGTT
jgi:hypothetical protein